MCFHDAAVDGWSVHSLHAELFETYLRLRAGETPAEEPEPLPYRHYAALEREARASEEQRGFWLRHLAGAETTRIPRCAAVPGAAGRRVASHAIVLPVGLSDRLRGLAARLGVPVKSVLLAAHVKVLGFLAGSEDVLTGYEHSGRPEVEHAESTLGLFLNTVPFRL